MSDYASTIIGCLVACIIHLVCWLICCLIRKSLYKKVAWCVCRNLPETIALTYNWHGVGKVNDFIEPEYRLNLSDPDEKKAAQTILSDFQEALSRSYFHDNIRCNYKIAQLTADEYCMMSLNAYLNGYNARTHFREYPTTAQKLLHISSEFCWKSAHVRKLNISEL